MTLLVNRTPSLFLQGRVPGRSQTEIGVTSGGKKLHYGLVIHNLKTQEVPIRILKRRELSLNITFLQRQSCLECELWKVCLRSEAKTVLTSGYGELVGECNVFLEIAIR